MCMVIIPPVACLDLEEKKRRRRPLSLGSPARLRQYYELYLTEEKVVKYLKK